MIRLTPVVKNIIIINVIMFVAQQIGPKGDFGYCVGAPGLSYFNETVITGMLSMWNVMSDCFRPYQLFTYMFLHADFFHILFNMLMLSFMGPILETFWGSKKFTIFYMVTGIGAAVFSIGISYFTPFGYFTSMLGASGAVYGVLMAYGMVFPDMEVRLMFFPIPIKAKYLVVILFTVSVLSGGNIAHFAHLGGIIFAFIMITAWRKQGGGGY
jgi:membrane associated rhomboid family serine protease